MIGFLRKDFYCLMSIYKKNLLLVVLLYAILTLATKQTFFLYFLIWMMGFYSLSAVTLDDSCGWNRYARTLPASPKKIVAARFLMTAGMTFAGAVVGIVMGCILAVVHGANLEEIAVVVVIVTGIALVTMGIMLPAAYKWGMEKARNGFLALFLVVFIVPLLMEKGFVDDASLQAALAWMDAQPVWVLSGGALLIALVVYLLGYGIACGIYTRKEY